MKRSPKRVLPLRGSDVPNHGLVCWRSFRRSYDSVNVARFSVEASQVILHPQLSPAEHEDSKKNKAARTEKRNEDSFVRVHSRCHLHPPGARVDRVIRVSQMVTRAAEKGRPEGDVSSSGPVRH